MYKFCQTSFFTGLVLLCFIRILNAELTIDMPLVIWTIGNGVGLLAGAIKSD